jgi:hypothetical protein
MKEVADVVSDKMKRKNTPRKPKEQANTVHEILHEKLMIYNTLYHHTRIFGKNLVIEDMNNELKCGPVNPSITIDKQFLQSQTTIHDN